MGHQRRSGLQQQLAGLPARLRYDDLVVAAAAGAPGALDASFERVSFGLRQPATLRLRWWPQAAGGAAVQLLAPQVPGDTPPLTGWPVDDRGAWCDRWSLPLGAASPTQRAQAWHAMDANDRGLLLGVLDALPAVAARAKALGLAEAGAADGLSAAASRPLRMAHRALHGTRLRRVVRALRGRVAA